MIKKKKSGIKDRLKTNIEKLNKKVLIPTRIWLSKNIFRRTSVVVKKTFQGIFSFKKIIIMTIIILFLPLLFSISGTGVDFDLVSSHHAATAISISLAFPIFFWSLGLSYTIFIGVSGGPLIADEIKTGTMLILISKPISRIKIFIGKYIGLYLYGMLLSFVSIFFIGWLGVLIQSGNFDHFIALTPFLTALFLYSLFILFLFSSITMALSSVFEKSRNASLGILLIVIFSYVAFLIIRLIASIGDNFYEMFQLYHFDLGYHLGNIFIFFIESLEAIPPSLNWQLLFGMMTGVYSTDSPIDPDQNINLGGLEKTNYYLPIFSLLIWLLIAILLLAFGIIRLRKRDISI
ncbi:MAG: ABC transporter permease [Candidatus Odinarchaeota archaeon]